MDPKTVNLVRQQAMPNPAEHDTESTIQTGKVNFSFMLFCNRFIKFRKIDVIQKVPSKHLLVLKTCLEDMS